jgi:hypothetical protein
MLRCDRFLKKSVPIYITFQTCVCNKCTKLFMCRHVPWVRLLDAQTPSIQISIVFMCHCCLVQELEVCTSTCWPWVECTQEQMEHLSVTCALCTWGSSLGNFNFTCTLYYIIFLCLEIHVQIAFSFVLKHPVAL